MNKNLKNIFLTIINIPLLDFLNSQFTNDLIKTMFS
jgi:hypothetical protein